MALRIVHANIHVGNTHPRETLSTLRSFKPNSIGINEGRKVYKTNITNYKRISNPHVNKENIRSTSDCVIFVKSNHKILGENFIKVCNAAEPIKIAPPRWFTVACFKHHLGKIAHISIHPHPSVAGADTKSNKRARQHSQSMKAMFYLVRLYQHLGFKVVVTGDVQTVPTTKITNGVTAYDIATKLGMKWKRTGIDAVFYFPSDFKVKKFKVIPKKSIYSDHDGFLVVLDAVTNR